MAEWHVYIDFDGDNSFESSEEITQYVQRISFSNGFSRPFMFVADEPTCSMTLTNTDKRFSPENTGSPYSPNFVPNKRVLVTYEFDSGAIEIMWKGYINTIDPAPKPNLGTDTLIQCSNKRHILQERRVSMALLQDKTADVGIRAILHDDIDTSTCTPWYLGVVGNSEIDAIDLCSSEIAGSIVEIGSTTFSHIGDNFTNDEDEIEGNKREAIGAIRDLVVGEWGKFFFDRQGRAVFWNRQHLQLLDTLDYTFDDSFVDIEYSYGREIRNRVVVKVYPRTITANNVLLAKIDEVIEDSKISTREFSLQFTDDDEDTEVGATNVLEPSEGAGTLNLFQRGNTCDDPTITYDIKATEVNVTIESNQSGGPSGDCPGSWRYIIDKMEFWGQKITTFNEIEIVAEDSTSIASYGTNEYTIDTPIMSDSAWAEALSNHILERFKNPRGDVLSMTLVQDTEAHMLQMPIGTKVRIVDDQLDHDQEYFIMGEQHNLTDGFNTHTVRYTLERSELTAQDGWRLGTVGRGELGTNTYLGF